MRTMTLRLLVTVAILAMLSPLALGQPHVALGSTQIDEHHPRQPDAQQQSQVAGHVPSTSARLVRRPRRPGPLRFLPDAKRH